MDPACVSEHMLTSAGVFFIHCIREGRIARRIPDRMLKRCFFFQKVHGKIKEENG